ncbi:MAG TPA: hypothetical protein GX507_11550, partial [Clostridia bacterium]|nr:hypothetical protein [Clostridia bacterium]
MPRDERIPEVPGGMVRVGGRIRVGGRVKDVISGSAAWRSGIERGDTITGV